MDGGYGLPRARTVARLALHHWRIVRRSLRVVGRHFIREEVFTSSRSAVDLRLELGHSIDLLVLGLLVYGGRSSLQHALFEAERDGRLTHGWRGHCRLL